MAQGAEDNLQKAIEEFQGTLQRLELDEGLNETQRLGLKRDLERIIDKTHQIPLPSNNLDEFENFHQTLRTTLSLERNHYFLVQTPRDLHRIEEYKSPRDFAEILHKKATAGAVIKLFQNQHKIKWGTQTGDPEPFSFYSFCEDLRLRLQSQRAEQLGREKFLKSSIRKAHVIERLRNAQVGLRDDIYSLGHQQLCPPVYVRTSVNGRLTWERWTCDNNNHFSEKGNTDIEWITNNNLKQYITNNSLQNINPNSKKKHLYWAVLEEDDFENNHPLQVANFGRTQVYVGKATNGIKDRWIIQSTSHCRKMKFSLSYLSSIPFLTSLPNLPNQQLVDLRLLLHKASYKGSVNLDGNDSGLFIMGQFDNDNSLDTAEKNNIKGQRIEEGESLILPTVQEWTPRNMKFGMNCKS